MTSEKHTSNPKDGVVSETEAPDMSTGQIAIDPAAEKRLIRKLDLMLSPMMVLFFLVAYLDRSNIGETWHALGFARLLM